MSRLAEYFVVCGLPANPRPYDYSKVLEHAEEITIPEKSVDFTAFWEPLVDICFVRSKDGDNAPYGYRPIMSLNGKHKAIINVLMGDEMYLCYRRGRERPPITNISIFTENAKTALKPDACKVKTYDGHDVSLKFMHSTYLTYTRAATTAAFDQLAVIDMCIIFPSKHETCPYAYNQIPEPIGSTLLGGHAYLCFRKSLIKEHTIAYEPEVLFWYRVPSMSVDFDASTSVSDDSASAPLDHGGSTRRGSTTLDPEIHQVANFCLPWGASIESWSVEQDIPQPNSFTFVLTNEAYERLYGVAFTFHEPYDISQLNMDKCYRLGIEPELLFLSRGGSIELNPDEEAKITARQKYFVRSRVGDRVVGVTKAICVLSRWSFPVAFTNFLAFLHTRCYPGVNNDPIPLERYLTHFLCEVPFPDHNTPNVMVELCAAPILLESPYERYTSSSCEPFFYLLYSLGVDVTINLFVHVLTEQKVLLTSVHHCLLTQVAEALTSMIFPLQWAVVYIPFIYMGHVQVIQSPSPYLIGVDSRFFDFFRLPSGGGGVTYVDLDTKNFKPAHVPGQPLLEAKLLPKKPLARLRSVLTHLSKQIGELQNRRSSSPTLLKLLFSEAGSDLANDELDILRQQQLWLWELGEMTSIGTQVRKAFIVFMAHLLKDYRQFVIPVPKAERDQLFNSEAFLDAATDDRSYPLYKMLFETQQWVNFVRDRSYTSARDEDLVFFDSLIDSMFHSDGRSLSSGSVSGDGSGDLCVDFALGSCDEASTSRLLSHGYVNSEYTRIIGPPTWPLPVELLSGNSDCATSVPRAAKPITSPDLMPINWNVKLLDRLAAYSYRIQTLSMEPEPMINPFDAPDWAASAADTAHTSHLPLNRSYPYLTATGSLRASYNSLNSTRLCGSRPALLDPTHAALADGSPMVSRLITTTTTANAPANVPLALTGLPTDYPLPVKASSILRRSLLELRYSMEYGNFAFQRNDHTWSKFLVSSIYSLWFMFLPSYLASLYTNALQWSQAEMGETQAREVIAMDTLNSCLTLALKVAQRLVVHLLEPPDQVIWRVLLVLIYQNRPAQIPLLKFMEDVNWNRTSEGLMNHIYKMYENECRERERLTRELAERHLSKHPGLGTHRRSASACCMADKSDIEFCDEDAAQTIDLSHRDTDTVAPLSSNSVACKTHKRSNSSATPATVTVSNGAVKLSKSETDSGVQLGNCIPDEHWMKADEGSGGVEPNREFEDTLDEAVKDLHLLNSHSAPLASVDDLTDLGYSTLHRPSSSSHPAINQSEIAETTVKGNGDFKCDSSVGLVTTTVPNHVGCQSTDTPSSVRHPQVQSTFDSHLEPVQKPSPAVWFEDTQSELYPTMPTRERPRMPDSRHSRHSSVSTTESQSSDSTHTPSDSADETDSNTAPSRKHQSHGAFAASARVQGFTEHADRSTDVAEQSPEEATHTKSRGSFDYLNNALHSIGTSELTAKVMRSVRSFFIPVSHTAGIGRRGSLVDRLLLTSPNGSRLPRNMRHWDSRLDQSIDCNTAVTHCTGESRPREVLQRPGVVNDAAVDTTATGMRNLHDLWLTVGEGLIMGTRYQRTYLATFPTQVPRCAPVCSPPLSPRPAGPVCSTPSVARVKDKIGQETPPSFVSDSTNPLTPDSSTLTDGVAVRLRVFLATCTCCRGCNHFVHDEEIMAAWSIEEEDEGEVYKGIRCPFCAHTFVPELTVRVVADVESPSHVRDASRDDSCCNQSDMNSSAMNTSTESPSHNPAIVTKGLMKMTFSYLSPLKLRKHLETVLQREGDECFRSVAPKHSLLYRHDRLTWNAVWYINRLGLPTHLLQCLPMWLMERQTEELLRLNSGLGSPTPRHADAPNAVCEALKHVKLSADLPVRVLLRWNAYQTARSMANKPLYKQWLHHKADYKFPLILTAGKPTSSPVFSPANLNLSPTSSCPVEATLARVVDAVNADNISYAVEALIQFRTSIQLNKPLSKVIRSASHRVPTVSNHHATSKSDAASDVTDSEMPKCAAHHLQCTESHQEAWCLEQSLYRELLFLTIAATPPGKVDLMAFDQRYSTEYQARCARDNSLIHGFDCPPNAVAVACRHMLRPLTLIP